MGDADFGFDTLSKQEAQERKSPKLSRLAAGFWSELWTYLDQLETTYMKSHADNPAARRTILLSDEMRNAMRKAEGLWEARLRKVTHHAMKNARREAPEAPDHLSTDEVELYADLMGRFQGHHRRVFSRQTAPRERARTPEPAAAPPPTVEAAATTDDVATVRALADIPPFVGLDSRTYTLQKGDVATIPKKMADMLIRRKKVAAVE